MMCDERLEDHHGRGKRALVSIRFDSILPYSNYDLAVHALRAAKSSHSMSLSSLRIVRNWWAFTVLYGLDLLA